MKIKFVVMQVDRRDEECARFDLYEDAEKWIEKHTPADLLGTVEYYIRKIYTNSDK